MYSLSSGVCFIHDISSASYICHGVGLVVGPFRSHVSRNLLKGLPWFVLPVGDPVSSKIVLDNKIIEQVKSFEYLGNMISYERELYIDNKLNRNLKVTGILTLSLPN
jgi:hypothetical protein